MYCRNCGVEVHNIHESCKVCGFLPLNGVDYCQSCGTPTQSGQTICHECEEPLKYATVNEQTSININPVRPTVVDEPNTGANVAAFCTTSCVPLFGGILGLVLFLIWINDKPKAAKSVCIWTIIPIALQIALYIVLFMFGLFSADTSYSYSY